MRFILIGFVALLALAHARWLSAQEQDQQSAAQELDLSTIPLDTKREWVRTQMIREFATGLDAAKLKKIDDTLANMAEERIDRLVMNYAKREQGDAEAQSQDARLAQQQDEAYRQARIAEYQARLAAARSGGNPGYAPVITTLPSGASLGASAVVSPDRRYVRMNLTPFFSSVGPVQTFTFANPYPYYPQHPTRPQGRVRAPWRP